MTTPKLTLDDLALEVCLAEHLPAQRWFGAAELKGIERVEVLRE